MLAVYHSVTMMTFVHKYQPTSSKPKVAGGSVQNVQKAPRIKKQNDPAGRPTTGPETDPYTHMHSEHTLQHMFRQHTNMHVT